MRYLYLFAVLVPFLFTANIVAAQITKVETPGPKGIKFKSAIDSQEYVLYINLPDGYDKTNKKYPVVYVTDAQWFFTPVLDAYAGQHYDGFVPDLIIVGITWTSDYEASRGRDLSPTHQDAFPNSGNAPRFLSVIKNEVITYIDSTYRTDKIDRTLYGTSLGGIFAVYTLFHEPALFNRYIIISPSLWWDNEIAFAYEKKFAVKNKALNAKVFISSGEYEEAVDPSNTLNRFCNQLKASKYSGLVLESAVLEKMSHSGSATVGACRGLQFVYDKPNVSVNASVLNQYTGRYHVEGDTVAFSRQGDSLYANFRMGKIKLYAENNETFYIKGMSGTGQFLKDDKGNVTGYKLVRGDASMFYKKID